MDEEAKITEQAQKQGWVEKDDFKGSPDDWVDAKTFLDKGEKIAGIVKERLEKEIGGLKTQISQMNKTFEDFGKYTKTQREQLVVSHQKEIDKLKVEQRKIAADPDGSIADYDRLGDQIKDAELETAKLAVDEPAPKQNQSPEYQPFLDRNPWMNTDIGLTVFANQAAPVILSQNPGLTDTEYYKKIEDAVKNEYPHKFGKDKKEEFSAVEGGSGAITPSSKGKKRTYANLPADAKAACDRFVEQKLLTQEDYVKTFKWT